MRLKLLISFAILAIVGLCSTPSDLAPLQQPNKIEHGKAVGVNVACCDEPPPGCGPPPDCTKPPSAIPSNSRPTADVGEGPNMPPIPWCPSCDPPRAVEMAAGEGPNMPPIPWCPSCDPPRAAAAAVVEPRART